MEVVVVLLLILALNLFGELNIGSGLDSSLSPTFRDFFSKTEHTVVSSSVSEMSLSIKGLSPTKLSSFLSTISGLSATPPVRPAPPAAHLSSSHRLPHSLSPLINIKIVHYIQRNLTSLPPIPFSRYCMSSLSGVRKSR